MKAMSASGGSAGEGFYITGLLYLRKIRKAERRRGWQKRR